MYRRSEMGLVHLKLEIRSLFLLPLMKAICIPSLPRTCMLVTAMVVIWVEHRVSRIITSSDAFISPSLTHRAKAEYLRVPFADNGLIPIPSLEYTNPTTNETVSLANDYIMVSDIFATGWTSLDFAGFQPGDTVAVFGAGPVGLMAAYSAILRGASTVYSVDYVPDRLHLAEFIGAIPINFRDADPVDQILALEPNGVTRSVDAVGYEQVNRNLTVQSDVIIHNMLAVTSAGGGLGTVGVYNHATMNPAIQKLHRVPPPCVLLSTSLCRTSFSANSSGKQGLLIRLDLVRSLCVLSRQAKQGLGLS